MKNKTKQGFTLSEILIVLIVIGLIGALAIPSLMDGVIQAQHRTTLKKAYNNLKSFMASEKISGNYPDSASSQALNLILRGFQTNFEVESYIKTTSKENMINNSEKEQTQYLNLSIGQDIASQANTLTISNIDDITPWVSVQGGYAFSVFKGRDCKKASEINSKTNYMDMINASCNVIVIDVNGANAPNMIEPLIYEDNPNATKAKLTGDRFLVYVGIDTITTGNSKYSVTTNILSENTQ